VLEIDEENADLPSVEDFCAKFYRWSLPLRGQNGLALFIFAYPDPGHGLVHATLEAGRDWNTARSSASSTARTRRCTGTCSPPGGPHVPQSAGVEICQWWLIGSGDQLPGVGSEATTLACQNPEQFSSRRRTS